MTRVAGRRTVLDIPELDVGPGVVHLSGPVGAGKTTLLRLATTLAPPTTGRITVDGLDTRRDGAAVRARTGYAGHEPALPPELSTAQSLAFHARVHGLPPGAVDAAIERLDLARVARRPVHTLSRGERGLCDLARATLHDPRVLLLDEPTTGLDEDARGHLKRLVDEARTRGALVVIAAHGDPGAAADRTLRIRDGRIQEAAR